MSTADFHSLSEKLASSHQRLLERQRSLEPVLNRQRVTLAGYGNKGRPLARYLRDVVGKSITVFDVSPDSRAAAEKDGFSVYNSREMVNPEDAVVLSATQHQTEQAAQFPVNHVFHEEAGYFFNAPFLSNRVPDFPRWILDNWNDVVEFTVGLPSPAREAMESILHFRLSLDPAELAGARKPVADMWFDIPAEFRNRPYSCFLDVGAFDGDTIEDAAARNFGFTKSIAIEANPDFEDHIVARSHLYSDGIKVVPCAAWHKSCRLEATHYVNGMMSVKESETGSIKAEPLDDVVTDQVDFLKMDIEGAEAAALTGAKKILAEGTDLAIAVYHRPEDILSIYSIVAESLKGFDEHKFYVGHYSGCLDDTIYYFLRDR